MDYLTAPVEPKWMTIARSMLGTKETKGPEHNSVIVRMFDRIHSAWIRDDETPWCAAFVGSCLEEGGYWSTRRPNAKSYLTFGRTFTTRAGLWPAYGAIAVLDRPPRAANGHVAFYVGDVAAIQAEDKLPLVYLLGGNQDDQVCVRSYPLARVVAWRWPLSTPVSTYQPEAARLAALVQNSPTARSDV